MQDNHLHVSSFSERHCGITPESFRLKANSVRSGKQQNVLESRRARSSDDLQMLNSKLQSMYTPIYCI